MKQLDISFQPGLTEQFPDIMSVVRHMVYGGTKSQKSIAYDLDESPSKLSRQLAEGGDIRFPLERLPNLIDVTDDLAVIYWLIEKYLEKPEDRRNEAVAKLAILVPEIQRLLSEATR